MRFVGAWLLLVPCALAGNLPTFTYSLVSNAGGVEVGGIATDSAGNTFIAGTARLAFSVPDPIPTTSGAFQTQPGVGTCFIGSGGLGTPNFGPCSNAFVVKLDPAGAVIFATYLGGNGATQGTTIAVDEQGNVYVAGLTSTNLDGANTFPVTSGAAFRDPATGTAFIAKLNPSGSQLVYATFIPATLVIAGLAVDPEGYAYITGTVNSGASFPTTAGAFQVSPKAGSNQYPGFVAKLNASGAALAYATYLSGSGGPQGADSLNAIAVDTAGDAFVTGFTYSTDFPVTPGAFLTTSPGPNSVFLTKLNPRGTGLVYSTYLGQGNATSVKVDAQGTAFVAGPANLGNFPITPGEVATGSGFLTRFSADGSSLIYSTGVPIPVSAVGAVFVGLDVDSSSNAAIAGPVVFAGLPAGVGAFQTEYDGTSSVYISRFTPNGQFSASTYLGGVGLLQAFAQAPNGSVVVAGTGAGSIFVTNFFISLSVLNAASYVPNTIAPGEIVSLLGYGIGPETGVTATGAVLPTELGGVQVSFGGFQAPLLYAQSHVINAQVPWDLAGQTSTTVLVSYPGVASTGTPVVVAPSLTGIFGVDNSDGTHNSPSNPAKPGDFITIYGTGGGPTSPGGVTGGFWPLTTPLPMLTLPVTVTVASENARVL